MATVTHPSLYIASHQALAAQGIRILVHDIPEPLPEFFNLAMLVPLCHPNILLPVLPQQSAAP